MADVVLPAEVLSSVVPQTASGRNMPVTFGCVPQKPGVRVMQPRFGVSQMSDAVRVICCVVPSTVQVTETVLQAFPVRPVTLPISTCEPPAAIVNGFAGSSVPGVPVPVPGQVGLSRYSVSVAAQFTRFVEPVFCTVIVATAPFRPWSSHSFATFMSGARQVTFDESVTCTRFACGQDARSAESTVQLGRPIARAVNK